MGAPLPPAELRRRVARSSARDEYLKAGGLAAAEIVGFLWRAGVGAEGRARWLDFGCGCGRLSWYLISSGACATYVGADVDEPAIRWCRSHLKEGRFEVIRPEPPTAFDSESFDLVFAASVFTHFDERLQDAWLDELHRILRPGGLLLASTHAPRLVEQRPEIGPAGRDELARTGFLFQPGDGTFNDGAAFHARSYLERRWGRRFTLRRFEEARLYRLQDLALWERGKW